MLADYWGFEDTGSIYIEADREEEGVLEGKRQHF